MPIHLRLLGQLGSCYARSGNGSRGLKLTVILLSGMDVACRVSIFLSILDKINRGALASILQIGNNPM